MIVADRTTTARRAVINDIARMEIADITALLDTRLLAERANRRRQIAAELVGFEAANARDRDEIATIHQTASDAAAQEAASERANTAMRERSRLMDALRAEDRRLAEGQFTLDLDGIHLQYDLAHYINPNNPDDASYSADARDARLSTNPFVTAIADGRLNRADLIRSVCQAAGVRIPAQYAAYGGDSAAPANSATLPRLHQATNRAASNLHPLLGRWLASARVMFTICAVCVAVVVGLVWFAFAPAAPTPPSPSTPSVPPATAAAPTFPTDSTNSARASVPLQLARALVVPAIATSPIPGNTSTGSTPLPTVAPQPHGPYPAPSQLAIPVFQLTLPVNRVRTHDSQQPDGTLQVVIDPPQIGEVTHYGAYPGEVGTLWLFSTNATLGSARRLQEKDQIVMTDRMGATFTYRIVPFSATGQAERVIDLNRDAWLFDQSDEAALVIVLPMPRTTPTTPTGAPPTGADDTTSPLRLAYRAILERYLPTTQTPQGTPIFIPDTVYTPHPYSLSTPTAAATPTHTPGLPTTSTPAAPASVTVTPPSTALPGLPNTGDGGRRSQHRRTAI